MYHMLELTDDRSERIRYDFADYPVYIRRGKLSYYPNYAAPSHWHDDIELIAVLSGEMEYHINGQCISMQTGEGVFVNTRQMHFGGSDRHKDCEFLCVLFHPLLLCGLPAMERDFVLPLLEAPEAPYVKLQANVPWQRRILEYIREIYEKKDALPLHLQPLLWGVWSILFENQPKASLRPLAPGDDLAVMKNMVGFIQSHYAEKIGLGDIAAAGAVGQSKCCRLFAQFFSKSPMRYLSDHRLSKAMEFLRDPERSISEIALETGFGSASYFTAQFRKWTGKSPSSYRRKQHTPS